MRSVGTYFFAILWLRVVPAAGQTADGKSLDEVNKELSNPISSIWAVQLQENTYWFNKPDRNVVNLQFQPVLPLAVIDDRNLITRPVFQLMNSTPYVNENRNLHRITGFGDTILTTMRSPSPKLAGPWLLGLGPSFIFPSASNSRLGQNKWQIGPARVRLSVISAQRGSVKNSEQRVRLYRIEFIERWSMIDVFVDTSTAALIQLQPLMSVELGPGRVFFAAVVVSTMLAVQSFDPRLIRAAASLQEVQHA